MSENRQEFERFISSPPFEKDIERFPTGDAKYPWPGAYCDITVELAWECWREATSMQIARFESKLAEAEAKNIELEKELFIFASDVIYFKNDKMPDWVFEKAKAIYYRPRLGKGE